MFFKTLVVAALIFLGAIHIKPTPPISHKTQVAAAHTSSEPPSRPLATPTPTPTPIATPQAAPQPAYVAPTPKPVTYTANVGCAAYRGLVAQYAWPVNTMMAIMQAESGCRANAISPLNYDGLSDYGLFQIHGEYILDPAANIARAYGKYTSQGLHAWSTYTNGAYLRYLQ